MFRYCSSVAFVAMLAFGCTSKNVNNGDIATGTGGAAYNYGTGGSPPTGGSNNGGGTTIDSQSGLTDITQAEADELTSGACVGWSSEGENVPAAIDFVVDTSGSMSDVAPNTTTGQSKWAITSTALQNSVNTLPSMTVVGMLLWPNMYTLPNTNTQAIDTANCVNESAMIPLAALGSVGSSQRTTLDSLLANATPKGGTPMADAYNYALGSGMGAYQVPATARYMVLITDGQPTIQLGCMGTGAEANPVDFTPVTQSIAGALTLGIETFVIGSPGSQEQSSTGADGRSLLCQAAIAGGTAAAGCDLTCSGPPWCHFDMSSVADFATGFAAALQNITGQVLPCDFRITNVPSGQTVDPTELNVVYEINGSTAVGNMKLVAPSADPSCPQGNGWYLDPNDSTHVILCPNTCNLIHQDAGAVLNFTGGCAPIINIG